MTVKQDEERMCLFALPEYIAVPCNPLRTGLAQDLVELLGGKTRKKRQVGNQ